MSKKGFWRCVCGYENGPKRDVCFVCQRSKEQALEPKKAPPPSPSGPKKSSPQSSVVGQTGSSQTGSWQCECGLPKGQALDSQGEDAPLPPSVVYFVSPSAWWQSFQFASKDVSSPPPPISAEETTKLIGWIARGTEEQMMCAVEEFQTHKPKEAIPALLEIVAGKTTDQVERRGYAIMALAAIGDPATVQHLTTLETPSALDTLTCDALGDIGDPAALPFLQEKVWQTEQLAPRASGMLAQAKIGHPQAFRNLILEAKDELVNTMYVDYDDNPGGSSGKLGLILLGGAMGIGQALRAAARTASFMGNPELPLQIAAEMPGLVRQMWFFRVRLMTLRALGFVCGTESLISCRSYAKNSIQHLMIALPLLQLMTPEVEWVNCLAESTRSRHAPERILAYDGYVQLATKYEEPIYIKWGRAGLYDGKNYVSTAVAASIIYNNVQTLVPEALDMARTSSTNKRISLIPPVVELARSGDPQGLQTLKDLMQDRKPSVRKIAQEMWKDASGSRTI